MFALVGLFIKIDSPLHHDHIYFNLILVTELVMAMRLQEYAIMHMREYVDTDENLIHINN